MNWDRLTTLVSALTFIYILSFLGNYYNGEPEDNLVRILIIIYVVIFWIYGMGIGSKDKLKLIFKRTYAILLAVIILVMIMTPMRYWAISMVISPLAFYFYRVKDGTRDIRFRNFRKLTSRIVSYPTNSYIHFRVLGLIFALLLVRIKYFTYTTNQYYGVPIYMTLITPVLIHDLVMIVLYFQMEYAPEIKEESVMEIQS